ncbi:patatin-like phospholipase family protein [Mongoliitalea daihaiensis]|uniref:patatin-like phospholipase family protein n=1 Tax=Mongoliitalea daihaiensis TaxID=2782006 RepID=UPI001F2BEF38|nr:patatin-like phospholipase family protein [Mongoliitalea daihaiensis]UJP63908.1 patatin-like phospholipase family protein [Mongoliitalea daihaiensis]
MKSNKKVGIVLSGGGIRGIAHLGVLKALNNYSIFPNRFSGSSAGAIAGALYCHGYSPDEILEIIIKTNYFKFIRPAISLTGLLRMETVQELYEKYLPENSFEALQIPLAVAATDIKRSKVVYFSEGELIPPIMASSCIPGMFDPIKINQHYYVDGGVLNNLPVEPLDGVCDVIIGVNSNHLPDEHNIKNIKNLIERTVIMSMNYNVYSRKNKCDYFIEPQGLARYGVFDYKKAPEIFQAGYDATVKFIEQNETILAWTNN